MPQQEIVGYEQIRSGTVQVAFPQDNIGVFGLSNGTPLGTGTWLDFGNNLTTALSGTVLRVDATAGGGGGGSMGFVGRDEGVFVGTGTVLDVVGGRATLSFSTPVLTLNISPDPVELTGLMGWDEGLPQGTGTILNVTGQRAVLSRSGTVLELNVSPDPIDNIGIFALDDGAAVGTGSTVNFGSNLTAVRTGTTLFIDATAGQGAPFNGVDQIGFYGHDEGEPLGTGTVLNVTGQRGTLSISGTVLNLNISPDPVEIIGVFGRNDGTNLGTGTVIDFGRGLKAAITGTTLFVHPFNGALTGQAWIANTGSANGMAWTDQDYNIQFYLGNGTDVISTGSISAGCVFVDVPSDSVIESWSVVADATGSIVTNIFKSTFAGFPPGSPLAGLGQPLMTDLRTNAGNATGTASLLKTDQLIVSISSASTIKAATVSLRAKKVNTS